MLRVRSQQGVAELVKAHATRVCTARLRSKLHGGINAGSIPASLAMKLHFAQRVIAKSVPRDTNGSNGEANSRRRELQIEINKNKVQIDRSVFAKTEEERVSLKIAKMQWKAKLNGRS